jgi:predicted Zn-dependent protease
MFAAIVGCAALEQRHAGQDPQKAGPVTRPLDPQQAERLKTVMVSLLAKMDKPLDQHHVSVSFWDDPNSNAANAGGGKFIVTRGLLEKANDEQLGGVMAHEVAHQDRGHVTELQTIGAGVGIASVLLDQISPLAGAIVPVAGDLLIAKPHGRQAEYEADAHAVTILRRSGMDGKAIMTNTLTWLKQTEGSSKGGFFATHPGTDDRIQKVQEMARWTFILLRPSHSATRWLYIPDFVFLTEQVSTNDVSRPGPKVRILPFHTIACLPLSRVIPDC